MVSSPNKPLPKVTVQLHTILQQQGPDGIIRRLVLKLPPGTTIQDLLDSLEIHLSPDALITAANGRVVSLNYEIKAGDKIDLMPAISGGGGKTGLMPPSILLLTEADVQQTLDMNEAIRLARKGLIAEAHNQVAGDKFYMPIEEKGFIKPFSGYLAGESLAFVKIFSFFPGANQRATNSQVLLYEVEGGSPACLMAGNWITGLKTGASTALTVEVLANQDARILTLFGAGLQGRMHLEALSTVRDLEKIWLVDVDFEKAYRLAESLSTRLGAQIIPLPIGDHQRAVERSDILVTVTSGNDALIEWPWIKPGTFIARLGSHQEIAIDVVRKADKVIVDRWKYVAPRIPELRALLEEDAFSRQDLFAEWPAIAGGKTPGREMEDEIILYIALGILGEYAAILPEVYRQALAKGLGRQISLGGVTKRKTEKRP